MNLENDNKNANVEYYTLSEDFTYIMAKLNLKGSPPDVRKNTIWGLELLHQAAIVEHIPEAMFSLGMLYFEGNKLNEDKAKAFKLFTQALKHFASSPDNRAKQEKTINYITQIVKLFIEQKLGDNLEVLNSFVKIKKAMQVGLVEYFQVKLEDGYLVLSIDRNIICKELVKSNELTLINNIILDESGNDA